MCSPTCPTFLLPYRRYASSSLLPLARKYLQQDRLSYQQAVAPGGRVIGYVTPQGQEKIDERALHRSTLWRLVLLLGGQTAALQVGLQLWSEHDPLSMMHRFVGSVSPHKHRSAQRGEILRTAAPPASSDQPLGPRVRRAVLPPLRNKTARPLR